MTTSPDVVIAAVNLGQELGTVATMCGIPSDSLRKRSSMLSASGPVIASGPRSWMWPTKAHQAEATDRASGVITRIGLDVCRLR
jgi:hypothetical protein